MDERETKQISGRLKRRGRRVRDAVLLVAGRGSRLRPLTDDTPKCLLEIGGEPLIVRLLQTLQSHGIERAYLVTGYLGGKIRETLEDAEGLPELHFVQNDRWDETNNAESLRVAMEEIEARPFLLCDGDVLIGDDDWMGDLLADPRPNVLAVLLQLQNQLGREEMKFQMEPVDVPWYTRRVVGLSKKLIPRLCHGESIGIQVVGGRTFEPLLERLRGLDEDELEQLYYEDVFARLIDADHEFYTLAVPPGSWTEIDTVEDLDEARSLYQDWTTEMAG